MTTIQRRSRKAIALQTVKRLKRPAPVFAVLTRHVTTIRGGKVLWGNFRAWLKKEDMVLNIKDAIRYARQYLQANHIGTIVYIARKGTRAAIPIWEAKWGHDNLPFMAWKPNPAAEYWRRRINA